MSLAMMLGVLGGCSAAPSDDSSRSSLMSPAGLRSDRTDRHDARFIDERSRDADIRDQTSRELGSDVAADMPRVADRERPEPFDPGAQMIVLSIANALPQRTTNDRGVTVIGLDDVRNRSRGNGREFGALRERLAKMLTRAGRDDRLEFISESDVRDRDGEGESELEGEMASDDSPHYRMQGSAYLVSADGFDQWELYLSMSPADRDVTVWDARNAVRVLRTQRPGSPQITYIGSPR